MSKSMSLIFLSAILLLGIIQVVNSLDCESCGKECQQICGTKRFRNCCYNYIRKRSGLITIGSEIPIELMMIGPEMSSNYPSFKNVLIDEDLHHAKMHSEGNFKEN